MKRTHQAMLQKMRDPRCKDPKLIGSHSCSSPPRFLDRDTIPLPASPEGAVALSCLFIFAWILKF